MKSTILTQVLAFVLTWALLVIALPSNAGGVPGISLRRDHADTLLGINCRGSSECGGYCHPNTGNIKYFVDQIADDVVFSNGEQIACHECAHCSDCPDHGHRGICVYAQNLKKDEKVTAKVVKDAVNALISHGCKKCGSCPIHPGNNVDSGEITINFVYNFCKTGPCTHDFFVKDAVSEPVVETLEAEVPAPTDVAPRSPFGRTLNEEVDESNQPEISPREAAPDSATTLLGINCRGSGRCSATCGRSLKQLRDIINRIPDTNKYKNGIRLACVMCNGIGEEGGYCAFPNNMKKDEFITGAQAKQFIAALIGHGCKGCGSTPVHPGNNMKSGQLTVNYADHACNDECKYTPPKALNDEVDEPIQPAVSPREAAPDSATSLLGINCRGSGRCSFTCKRNIFQLNGYVQTISDDTTYGNGQKIACVRCINESGHTEDTGFCAFPNNMKKGETITGAQAKSFMAAIIAHGCKGCGSTPVHPGNNINSGQLTVNFVYEACGEGVC